MQIPCVVIVIPSMTSSNKIEPVIMQPLYQEIWGKRLAGEQKSVYTEPYPREPQFLEVDSIAAWKADLAQRWEYNPVNGQPLFAKVYPNDSFEKAAEALLAQAAADELNAAKPKERRVDADLLSLLGDRGLVLALHDIGINTLAEAGATSIGRLCEIKNLTPGGAKNLLDVLVAAVKDDEDAKALAAATPAVPDPKAVPIAAKAK